MVKTSPSSAVGKGLIPSPGAEIPLASWPKNPQNIKQKQYCNKFNEVFKNGPHQKKKIFRTSLPLQYSRLENPMDGGAWKAAVHGVTKSWTRLSDFTFTFHFHALEKEMATHSSVLAWRIPGTREPGGLRSMGSHKVRHD